MARIAFYAIIAAAISAGRTAGVRHESGEYNMDPWLGNAKATSEVLRRHDIRIKKKFGQNFLIDRNILEKIPKAAGITKDDLVLEIGPGIGTLTQYLSVSAREVISVEIDRTLLPVLEDTLDGFDNVTVINDDILKVDIAKLAEERNSGRSLKIAANLPYYITTPIIMGILESGAPADTMVFMVQKEVADRISAQPGGKEYGVLSLAVQYYCETYTAADVPPESFIPRPEVFSSVVVLKKREEKTAVRDEALMFRLIRTAFSQRRKTLMNCLRSSKELGLGKEEAEALIEKAGLEPNIRGEALPLETYAKMADIIASDFC